MRYFFILLLLASISSKAQNIPVIKYADLEKRVNNTSDTLYLINYWATWCVPCVEELPDFVKLDDEMQDKNFKMILVSLDFPQHIQARVIPFLERKGIQTEVQLLDDDANTWINKVNKDWDGAIPVTQFIFKGKQEFVGHPLHYDELKTYLSKYNF